MRNFEVSVGYYEYNIFMDDEHLISIGDPNEDLYQITSKRGLQAYCRNTIDAYVEEYEDKTGVSLNLTKREYASLCKQLYDLYIQSCDFKEARKLLKNAA